MAWHELHRLETIDWYTHTGDNPKNVSQYRVTLIGYFTKNRCDQLKRMLKARWKRFYREIVEPRGLGIGELTPVVMFADDACIGAVDTDFELFYLDDSDNADCVQIPLPIDLMKPLERAILLAESLKMTPINDMQRQALQRELSSAERQSGWDRYETRDSRGRLVGYLVGSYVLREWGLERIKYDTASKRIALDVALDDKDRLEAIRGQLNGNSRTLTTEQRSALVNERSRLRKRVKYPPIDWRELFQTAREHFEGEESNLSARAGVISYLRKHIGQSNSEALVIRLNSILGGDGASTVQLGGNNLTVGELMALVAKGDHEAEKAVIDLLVSAAVAKDVNNRATSLEVVSGSPSSHGTEGWIPDWAKPEKSFIERWAETTRTMGQQGADGEIGRAVAEKVGKGKVNVLVFGSDLYHEIAKADIVGDPMKGVMEFPFPLAIVPLWGIPDIYGVAVFSWDELLLGTANRVCDAGNYGVAYLLNGGGVTTSPGRRALDIGDKLVTYLDCESVQFDTAYIDAGTSNARVKSAKGMRADASERAAYVKGADFTTGARVVVERDGGERRADGKTTTRRSHFRRGFFRRQRVGSRNNWYYEMRWIKPTFVHGSQAIITERKVRRMVL